MREQPNRPYAGTHKERGEQMDAIEKRARKMAREWINEQRAKDGMKPRTGAISKLWWALHGGEWIAKAKAAAPRTQS